MKDRIKEKWPFALLSFFILTTAGLPFLNVYQLAQTNTLFFVGILALICFMTLLIQSHLIIFPFYVLSYFFTLYYYFPSNQIFGFTWFSIFVQKLLHTYPKMILGEINYLPDFFALSIILFLLIILSVLLIRYERWILGYLLLASYLLMLAVFNQLNLGIQVILLTTFAILFYGLKHYPHVLVRKEKRRLFLLSGVILFLIAGSSYFFLAVFPQPKNFLFTQTATIRNYINRQGVYQQIEAYGTTTNSKAGFSENDAQLGGPIADDQTVIFTAKQTSDHYWRVETKNYYTGKGWKNTSETVTTEQPLTISTNPEYQGVLDAETTITLSFNRPKDYLPYPYGIVSVAFNEIGQTEQIKDKQRVKLLANPKTMHLTWQKLDVTQESLQQVPYQISQEQQTVQIPPTLPKRIQKLAVSLTENQETLYGKVKAIEQYLKRDGGYRYSKVDTPFTPQNEDYVDYFLFESKIGYCDNFSSAMTILLRSLGISSRWAKGFSPGEITNQTDAEYQEYTIKNSDAHSWPEVYFEGYGWIPFEPTPSFTNELSQNTVATNSTIDTKPISNSSDSTASTETANTTAATSSSVDSSTKKDTQASKFPQRLPILRNIGVSLVIILLTVGSFFLTKYFFLLRFSFYLKVHPKKFANAYILLLRKAEHILPRQVNEPLNNYAKRFENSYSSLHGSFIQLTALYENTLYGGVILKGADYAGLLMHMAQLLTNLKKNQKNEDRKS